jgi:hypothetical protein
MNFRLFFSLLLLTCSIGFSQISSGEYDSGLNIAYNPKNKLVTGYFENYTGMDETTGNPRFSCIFYLEGFNNNGKIKITSYYPIDKKEDLIDGEIQIVTSNKIKIKLSEEHGGCWNVAHFADEFTTFEIQTPKNWIEIRYIAINKAYFYGAKDDKTKKKSYLIKGDIIYIDKIENNWIHCHYFGNKTSEGWLKLESTNKI